MDRAAAALWKAMRHWWVNQNQTYRHEVGGGYLWSPKRNRNGSRNPFYQAMREVAPGDVVLSFRDTRRAALGIVKSYCYESPKATEFGPAGANWEAIGWKVDTAFVELERRVRPKDFIAELQPHLATKYAPLQRGVRVRQSEARRQSAMAPRTASPKRLATATRSPTPSVKGTIASTHLPRPGPEM